MRSKYTKCDEIKEKSCRQAQCNFVKKLGDHWNLLRKGVNGCMELTELNARLAVLENCKVVEYHYPKQLTDIVICEILKKKRVILKNIKAVIDLWHESFYDLRMKLKAFHDAANKLDWRTKSEFIEGTACQKPLKYYLDTSEDIVIYFLAYLRNVQMEFDAINISNVDSIDKLEKVLVMANQSEDTIEQFFINCRCFIRVILTHD